MGTPSLLVALDYLDLLADVKPEKLERATVRRHGRLEVEATAMTLAESQLALAALASLCAGERVPVVILGWRLDLRPVADSGTEVLGSPGAMRSIPWASVRRRLVRAAGGFD
jgi:hypothetical protein